MKTYIAAIAIALTATPAMATVTPTHHVICDSVATVAAKIMWMRLDGFPAPRAVEEARRTVRGNHLWDGIRGLEEELVYQAYKSPKYLSRYRQHKAVSTFSDGVYIGCREGLEERESSR